MIFHWSTQDYTEAVSLVRITHWETLRTGRVTVYTVKISGIKKEKPKNEAKKVFHYSELNVLPYVLAVSVSIKDRVTKRKRENDKEKVYREFTLVELLDLRLGKLMGCTPYLVALPK